MKKTLLLLILVISPIAFSCVEKDWHEAAREYLQKKSPQGGRIELERQGRIFAYSVTQKSGEDQYSESGSLEVSGGAKGECQVIIQKSQVQSQGKNLLPRMKTSDASTIDLKRLQGRWISSCVQTQSNGKQGHVREEYRFIEDSTFEVKRAWHKDPACRKVFSTDKEKGTFKIGQQNTDNGFNPARTFETQFIVSGATELGLLWVNEDYSRVRISRGFGSSQNTMLSLPEYTRF